VFPGLTSTTYSAYHLTNAIIININECITSKRSESIMATNPPKGDGHRNGAVRNRSQVYNPKTDTWTKRDKNTGQFMDQKSDGTPFKGVRKEK
jgi:hypothetical protein